MITDSQRARNIRRRVYRWAGRNAFDAHVTKAELRWLDAYDKQMLGRTWYEERSRMMSFAVAYALRTPFSVWAKGFPAWTDRPSNVLDV